MPNGPFQRVVACLRRVVRRPYSDTESDGALLARFTEARDESAFGTLVHRHGPMVLGVCRRVLGPGPDAEDAFQATFLVLVRKADSLGTPELLGNWLYGVAHRTALKARGRVARRRVIEQQVPDMPHPVTEPRDNWNELQPLLDQELSRLPEKYRTAVVLCDLQGKPRSEVARRLGLPEGTLSSRLATGRRMLAEKLARHGVTLSGGALATLLADQAAAATLPASLVDTTIQAATVVAAGQAMAGVVSTEAVALSEEVLQAMFTTKLKTAAVLMLTVGILASGAGYLTLQALADKPVNPEVAQKKPAAPDEVKKDKKPAADEPQKDKKPQTPSAQGIVSAVDAAKGTITVRVRVEGKKETKEETYTVGKDAKVLLADFLKKGEAPTEGKLADLSAGTVVSLQLTEDKQTIASITARGPTVRGQVQSVAEANKAITVTLFKAESKEGEAKTLEIVDGAKVLRNEGLGDKKADASKDQEGKLTDLVEGTPVSLQLSVDQKRVLGIRVENVTRSGTLVGYDAGNNTITISNKGDGDKSYTLAKDATVVDLVVGTRVNLRFSVLDKEKVIAAHGVKNKE